MRDPPDRLQEAVLVDTPLHVTRMDDHSLREVQYLADKREALGGGFPQRRNETVDNAMGEHPADGTCLALHRSEIALGVPAAERHAGDEMVDDEVVEDDEAGAPPQRLHDPAVGPGIVADVVEGDVGAFREAQPRTRVHVDETLELRQQQGAVVGDSRSVRRQRRVVRDFHAGSNRSIAASHVTPSAASRPARPHSFASSRWAESQRTADATASAAGSQTRPLRRSATISSGPPASRVVITGFWARNASNGTMP